VTKKGEIIKYDMFTSVLSIFLFIYTFKLIFFSWELVKKVKTYKSLNYIVDTNYIGSFIYRKIQNYLRFFW